MLAHQVLGNAEIFRNIQKCLPGAGNLPGLGVGLGTLFMVLWNSSLYQDLILFAKVPAKLSDLVQTKRGLHQVK